MKLSIVLNLLPTEAKYASANLLTEDGEGPRLKFGYPNFNVDPSPDILMLGKYRHPNTGNNLLGGINLHYLTSHQVNDLQRALPDIIKPHNLYGRYWAGRRLVPDVFKNFYRTYNMDYVSNAKKDIIYPKKGIKKASIDWIRKKIANLFKSKRQKELDDLPKYPDDLSNLQNRLDTIAQRADVPPEEPRPEDTPEIQAARDAFLQYRREKEAAIPDEPSPEDMQLRYAKQDAEHPPDHSHDIEEPGTGKGEEEEILQDIQDQDKNAEETKRLFELEREQNRKELEQGRDIDLLGDEDELEESLIYYSPIVNGYVVEKMPV
jgi:hypothetical protein